MACHLNPKSFMRIMKIIDEWYGDVENISLLSLSIYLCP